MSENTTQPFDLLDDCDSELVSELKSLRTLADSYIPIAKSVGNINLLALSGTFKARLDAILKELDVD